MRRPRSRPQPISYLCSCLVGCVPPAATEVEVEAPNAARASSQLNTTAPAVALGTAPALKPAIGAQAGSGGAPESVTLVLPYRLQLAPANRSLPVIERFSVRFGAPCVSRQSMATRGEPTGETRPEEVHGLFAHLEEGVVPPGYRLRVRLDGHTSRRLSVAHQRKTVLSLEALANEWAALGPGPHEVVVFARGDDGLVPATATGELAMQVCRFQIGSRGEVSVLSSNAAAVLLQPEGTLYGPDAVSAVVQVGSTRTAEGGTFSSTAQGVNLELVVRRPDGGSESHAASAGAFLVAPLTAGDYGFRLVSPDAPEQSAPAALGYLQWITVNPE